MFGNSNTQYYWKPFFWKTHTEIRRILITEIKEVPSSFNKQNVDPSLSKTFSKAKQWLKFCFAEGWVETSFRGSSWVSEQACSVNPPLPGSSLVRTSALILLFRVSWSSDVQPFLADRMHFSWIYERTGYLISGTKIKKKNTKNPNLKMSSNISHSAFSWSVFEKASQSWVIPFCT